MGKLTDIYNIVWRLPEYSVFLFYCVCKPFRFFSAHFLQVKFWNLGRVIGRQIDTDLEFSKSWWKFGTNLMKLPAFAFRTALQTKNFRIQEVKKKKQNTKAKSTCCRGLKRKQDLNRKQKCSQAFKQKLWSEDTNNKLHNVRFK